MVLAQKPGGKPEKLGTDEEFLKVEVTAYREDFGVYTLKKTDGKIIGKLEMAPGEITLTLIRDITYKAADGEKKVIKDAEEQVVLDTNTWKIKAFSKPQNIYSAPLEGKESLEIDDTLRIDGKAFVHHFHFDLENQRTAALTTFRNLLRSHTLRDDWEVTNQFAREGLGAFMFKVAGIPWEMKLAPQEVSLSTVFIRTYVSDKLHRLPVKLKMDFVFAPDLQLKEIHVPRHPPVVLHGGEKSVVVPDKFTKDGETFSYDLKFSADAFDAYRKSIKIAVNMPFVRKDWEKIKEMKRLG